MKRTPLKSKSARQRAIDRALDVVREILKIERGGARCELCGKTEDELPFPLSLFHIIPRSQSTKLILHSRNILLACWNKEGAYYIRSPYCHNIWEHQKFLNDGRINPKWQVIEDRIKELRGENYKDELKVIEKCQPVLSMVQIECQYAALKKYLEILKGRG